MIEVLHIRKYSVCLYLADRYVVAFTYLLQKSFESCRKSKACNILFFCLQNEQQTTMFFYHKKNIHSVTVGIDFFVFPGSPVHMLHAEELFFLIFIMAFLLGVKRNLYRQSI